PPPGSQRVECSFPATVQKGCFAATNSTGTFLTKPFNQRVHSSIPFCSLGICPITINALLRPWLTASAAYSTVSHSRVSPTSNTCTSSRSSACVSRSKPAAPGLTPTLVTFIPGSPTTRTTGEFSLVATSSANFLTVVSGRTNRYWFSEFWNFSQPNERT